MLRGPDCWATVVGSPELTKSHSDHSLMHSCNLTDAPRHARRNHNENFENIYLEFLPTFVYP
jgi:hypothetical protein